MTQIFTSAFGALADMAGPCCRFDPVAIDPTATLGMSLRRTAL
jgi:hypothetical protein